MLKYESYLITFTEVPDEISLCFNISNCPCHCEECFEPWLAQDIGDPLTFDAIKKLYLKHNRVSCICFMGGDIAPESIAILIMQMKREFPNLKFAMYSGRTERKAILEDLLDYYKVGPYIPKYGPLNKKTTNQHFYKKENNNWIDITYRFQEEKK